MFKRIKLWYYWYMHKKYEKTSIFYEESAKTNKIMSDYYKKLYAIEEG